MTDPRSMCVQTEDADNKLSPTEAWRADGDFRERTPNNMMIPYQTLRMRILVAQLLFIFQEAPWLWKSESNPVILGIISSPISTSWHWRSVREGKRQHWWVYPRRGKKSPVSYSTRKKTVQLKTKQKLFFVCLFSVRTRVLILLHTCPGCQKFLPHLCRNTNKSAVPAEILAPSLKQRNSLHVSDSIGSYNTV